MSTRDVLPSLLGASRTRLRTLGTLSLTGSALTRPKPLLLLAYLAQEGPTDRERLARLFFSTTQDPRDALSTTLRRLRGLVGPVAETDMRLSTTVVTDAQAFQASAFRSEPKVALGHYAGAFAQGIELSMEPELEEWVISTRERLACLARDLHLAAARAGLRRRSLATVWVHAQAAVGLTETFSLDPVNTAGLLRRLNRRGLPVPEGWWKATGGGGPSSVTAGGEPTGGKTLARRRASHPSVRGLRHRPYRRLGELM